MKLIPTHKILLAALFASVPLTASLRAEKVEILTTPPADGEFSSPTALDVAEPEEMRDLELAVKTGKFYGQFYAAVFEFGLAEEYNGRNLESATIELSTNHTAKDGEKALSPVEIEIFGYDTDNANGMIETADLSGGQSLGTAIGREEEIASSGKLAPIDVTAFVQKALDEKKKFVGFRLMPKDLTGSLKAEGLVIRASEFGADFPGNEPKLILNFAD